LSGGIACQCPEKDEPLLDNPGANRPARAWRIRQYRHNNSTFHGGYQSSEYSGITCLRCGATWRTKAAYVDLLQYISRDEEYWYSDRSSYEAVMKRLGRPPDHGRPACPPDHKA